ncbi:MAG: cysteine synthase CysM [Cytophagales bacterium]
MEKLIDLVGNTPMVDISRMVGKPKVKIFAKMEGHNPGGSVKDRAAKNMILTALEEGTLKPGMKLIEATSGNTGIALAMMARLVGVEIELVMPENSTKERVLTMEAFGAKVVLTSAKGSMEEAIDYAHNKVAEGGYLMLNQFANPNNFLAHYKTTAPEIWKDTKGEITHFVCTMGTTGTIMGTSRFLKEKNQDIQIVGCQPTDGSRIPGIRRWPKEYLPKIYEPERVDRIIDISESDAIATTRRLAKEEAIFAGMSSGGSTWAALKVAQEIEEGMIVCIICDRGDRYLSSDLFG